ncbi:hypothetical protein G0U57_000270, partial [Chelydra serpentina]
LPSAPIRPAAPLSPSERSSTRPLWAAGLLPRPPPDLETVTQLCVQVAESPSVRQRFVLAEVTRVGDLLDYDRGDWLDPLTLARCMGLSGLRTPRHILQEVRATLPPAARAYLDQVLREGTPRPPSTSGPLDLLIEPLPHGPNRPAPSL